MVVQLETPRMVLRPFTADDLDDLVGLDADPVVMHFVTGGLPTSRQELEDEVLPAFIGPRDRPDHLGYWAAQDKATGQFLGWFHFRPGDGHDPDEPELGYRLRRSAWGHGLATEGCRAIIDHGFRTGQVRRVVAETMAVHIASRRVMEKAGLRPVRTFHADWPYPIPGDEHGDVEYALERTEWDRRQP